MSRSDLPALALSLNPSTLEGVLELMRGELAELVEHLDTDDIARVHRNVGRCRQLLAAFADDVETALSAELRAPIVVDGYQYETYPKRATDQWDRNAVILDAVRENADHPDRLAQLLMDILPANVAWRKGKTQDEGMRSHGMNPDDYHTRGAIKGYGLRVTEVKP